MALPVDFLQTPDGDLDVSKGLRHTPTDDGLVIYTQQKLSETFAFFLGECFLNTRLGVPYFEHIYGHAFDRALCTTIYRRAAQKTPGVGSVLAVNVEFRSSDRTLLPSAVVQTVLGAEVTFVPFEIGVT